MATVHRGHRGRMRKRFQESGIFAFRDHEVIEMLLFGSIPRGDTSGIACALLEKFGSVSGVFEASYDQLLEVEGMGEASAGMISFMLPIFKRYYCRENGDITYSSYDYVDPLRGVLGDFSSEHIAALYLGKNDNILYAEKVFNGGFDSSEFSVLKLIKRAVASGASKFVVAHNHPSGVAVPSSRDVRATESIKVCSETFGVPLVDHLVMVDDDYISMAESKMYSYIFASFNDDDNDDGYYYYDDNYDDGGETDGGEADGQQEQPE